MTLSIVMAGHSRPKDGVASLAYVAGIHVLLFMTIKDVDGRNKSGHDDERVSIITKIGMI